MKLPKKQRVNFLRLTFRGMSIQLEGMSVCRWEDRDGKHDFRSGVNRCICGQAAKRLPPMFGISQTNRGTLLLERGK